MRRLASSFIKRGLLVAGGLLVLSAGAYAQRWENAYGDPVKEETARNGVRPVSEGGYVSVGSTKMTAAPFLEDVYVVRADNHGLVAWSKSYDIGDIDVGTDIEEVKNAQGATDGFIITGYTNHRAGSTCGNSYDVFLLRIDRCGNVVWQHTYGGTTTDEYGWDVVEARLGNGPGNPGPNPGDFIVAGWRGNTPARDGYLLRVDPAGVIVWGKVYNGPNNQDDYFYSLDEATTINPGEIVAAGGTTSYRVPVNLDSWLVRVNGNTGLVATASAYGTGTTTEEFRSVQELNSGGNAGHVVAVGQRTTATGVNRDVYLLETDPVFGFIANVLLGFNVFDEGFYVREIPIVAPDLPSTVVVTGYLTPPQNWGHGGEDAFLQEFTTGTLAPVGLTAVYGNANNDRGWSVEPVELLLGSPCFTSGFIVAGFIQRPLVAPADPLQLYMFKADGGKSTGCELKFTPPTMTPASQQVRQNPTVIDLTVNCIPPITSVKLIWEQVICPLDPIGTQHCPIPNCPPPPGANPDHDQNLSERSIDMTRRAFSY